MQYPSAVLAATAARVLLQGLEAQAPCMLQHIQPPILCQHAGVEEQREVLHPGLDAGFRVWSLGCLDLHAKGLITWEPHKGNDLLIVQPRLEPASTRWPWL